MEALVITGGQCPPPEFLKRLAAHATLVIAADSGLDAARGAGIQPDVVVGDFDSLNDLAGLDSIPQENILTFPREKDDTDTEIAIQTAWNKGFDYVVLAGGGGGRLDHLLAVWALFARERTPQEWHTGSDSVYLLEKGKSAAFKVSPGVMVSVFPAGCEGSKGMSSSGLKWPLNSLTWDEGRYGISNESTGGEVHISAGSSSLLIILPLGCERLSE
ncbi:MAG: thiamine diphosphokinase [Spirochaetae bacterium HGW-Spirochaetae-9]|nr:MAG: thiamine diphosphokinase [Spirochaetae bacterium HGW-Spirochaetae-9]